ncbi:Glutamate racemase [Croceitalea dokdonensis DOKDO 023]|uniref:Glutamate racemase n=1 Tax=Croceitalea dokdonensis DOKDO 023 TaxID=1300341 RepID=A0A0P7AV53_9FLAO|nr:glutamate racemase [Croceitalea dokdonensis]KPM32456.1 Glutamate racemase [Croceitalea dokdonensis DOKDO 023]
MDNPIGIFDSGVGGTSIWKEIKRVLPNENTIYLADSANAPYGSKSKEEILQLSIKNTEFLLQENCKLIVVACNTATTNAIDHLRKKYPIPFIGIEPAIKPAALHTKTGKVGILATKGTLSSSLFHSTSRIHAGGIEVYEQEGKGLVELIEAGNQDSKETKRLLLEYVKPMLNAGIDCLVLGCTHYPYLIPTLKKILPKTIQIIDSGYAVAMQTKNVLKENRQLRAENFNSNHSFYTNKDVGLLNPFVGSNVQTQYLDF